MVYFLSLLNGNTKYVLLALIFEQGLRLSPATAATAQFCVYAAAAAAAAAQTYI